VPAGRAWAELMSESVRAARGRGLGFHAVTAQEARDLAHGAELARGRTRVVGARPAAYLHRAWMLPSCAAWRSRQQRCPVLEVSHAACDASRATRVGTAISDIWRDRTEYENKGVPFSMAAVQLVIFAPSVLGVYFEWCGSAHTVVIGMQAAPLQVSFVSLGANFNSHPGAVRPHYELGVVTRE